MIFNSPIAVSLDGRISCRLYEDTRPHCLEIAQLQKGLVLLFDGEEIIEEGIGFGVPVVIYRDEPYFSSTAECSVLNEGNRKILVKSFVMDTISRKRIGEDYYVNEDLYAIFQKRFNRIYTRNSILTPFFNKLIELIKLFGMNTEFVNVQPRGVVNVKYTCLSNTIEVEASFDKLEKKDCKEVVFLNEQGAGFFRKYTDSNGLTLQDGQIGAWVPVNADEASLSNVGGTLAFALRKTDGAVFFRGREKIRNRYSWVGLGYSLSPTRSALRYTIRLSAHDVRQRSLRL